MRYIIIGASAAGINAAKTLRKLHKDSEIIIISKDEHVYSRCMLHHIIGENRTLDELSFIDNEFFEKNNIKWVKGKNVEKIDIDNKKVIIDGDEAFDYDKLLIASGASAFIPPVPNLREGKGIYTLRNIEDAQGISKLVKEHMKVVVIGAGLVGIDAAVGLIERKAKPIIIEMGERILPLQLDNKAASVYERKLKEEGAEIFAGVSVKEIILNEEGYAKGVILSDGKTIDCDLIVCAAGVRPNIGFIDKERIKVDRGIVINDRCETTVDDIYAAGDVTALAPIWPVAVKQGIVAAYNMVNKDKKLDDYFAFRNSMNFFGVETVSLGIINAPDESFKIEIFEGENVYKKIIHKDGIIHGVIFQGDISYCGVYTRIIKNKLNISDIQKDIFDIDFSDFYDIKEDGQYEYKIK